MLNITLVYYYSSKKKSRLEGAENHLLSFVHSPLWFGGCFERNWESLRDTWTYAWLILKNLHFLCEDFSFPASCMTSSCSAKNDKNNFLQSWKVSLMTLTDIHILIPNVTNKLQFFIYHGLHGSKLMIFY